MKDVKAEVSWVKSEKELNKDAILHLFAVLPAKDPLDLFHHSSRWSSFAADGPATSIGNGVHDEWFHYFVLAILERLLTIYKRCLLAGDEASSFVNRQFFAGGT